MLFVHRTADFAPVMTSGCHATVSFDRLSPNTSDVSYSISCVFPSLLTVISIFPPCLATSASYTSFHVSVLSPSIETIASPGSMSIPSPPLTVPTTFVPLLMVPANMIHRNASR